MSPKAVCQGGIPGAATSLIYGSYVDDIVAAQWRLPAGLTLGGVIHDYANATAENLPPALTYGDVEKFLAFIADVQQYGHEELYGNTSVAFTTWYTSDEQYSVRLVSSWNATVLHKYAYDPYGTTYRMDSTATPMTSRMETDSPTPNP